MTYGRISPAYVDAIYGSEIKHGWDKKRGRYLYLIDGEKVPYKDVAERAEAEGLKPSTIHARLAAHYSTTWAELLRPIGLGTPRNDEEKRIKAEKRAKTMRLKIAWRKAKYEKYAAIRIKNQGHKQL